MKKTWEEPQILVQKFIPNEYVAACGDSGTTYYFECNAGSPYSYQSVYVESNGVDGLQTSSGPGYQADTHRTWTYHACGEKHTAESNDEFLSGYVVSGGQTIPVIIWTDHGTNTHCTTNLNQDDWETAKS